MNYKLTNAVLDTTFPTSSAQFVFDKNTTVLDTMPGLKINLTETIN